MRYAVLIVALVAVAACGEDNKKTPDAAKTVDAKPIDAAIDAKVIDAPPDAQAFVLAVTCPATPNAAVITNGFAFEPMTVTIPLNGIVQFTMPVNHSVEPSPTLATDSGLRVGFSQVKCLQFTKTGTFNYDCFPHHFVGSVTVN
jgi:plastocyanin